MDLTIVILTKNEEKNIVAAVENAKKATDHVLIVDSGSTDATVALAEEHGAKVVFRAWDNDFATQRNFALEHVQTKWVLYLDADEIMNAALIAGIRDAVTADKACQYGIVREIRAFGEEFKHGVFKPDYVLRMFPVDSVEWKNKVHERPVCSLEKRKLPGFVNHYTYDRYEQWWDKAGKYTTIWAEDAFANGKRTSVAGILSHVFFGFIKAFFVQMAFLDGWGGFVSSFLHTVYTFMKYAKLMELQNNSKG